MDCKEFAKELRKEIKAKIKAGVLPAGKYSVRSDYNKIYITPMAVEGVNVMNPEHNKMDWQSPRYSKEGSRILDVLTEMADRNKFNRNAGDWTADYCDCNYYTCVQYDFGLEKAHRLMH